MTTSQPAPSGARRGMNYAGLSPDERIADRRARLMAAGLELFAARGYDGVTVGDVCTSAQIAKRNFYEFFADREALLLAVHRAQQDWLMTVTADAVPAQPADVEEALQAIITALIHTAAAHPDRARVIYISAPRMERRRRGLMHKNSVLIGRLVQRATGTPPEPDRFGRVMLALTAGITEVIMDWISGGMIAPADQLIDDLTGLCVGAISPIAGRSARTS